MRAVVYDRYGPPENLRVAEVEKPAPQDDEILVKVHATTVSRTDAGLRSAEILISRFVTGVIRPRQPILGMEFAGEVEAVGSAVSEFKRGDRVFGGKGSGAHAEYLTIREAAPIAHMPAGASFDEAAAVFDGMSLALPCLEAAGIHAGQQVLVFGASGSVGTAAVQLARHFGADVTAVCGTKNVELVRSLGADHVIDFEHEDFTTNGKRYDAIFDAIGMHSYRRCHRSLKPGGTYVDTDLGFMGSVPLLMLLTKWVGAKRVKLGLARFRKDDLLFLKGLLEAGEFRAVIDRRYPLEDVVEATTYVEGGQKTGNVVLTVAR
jgi:NADPH:quinone reductase-like Zn-dependent oxidoreductase